MPETRKLVRDKRPETTGLTWRFVGRTFPLVFGTYFAGIAAVRLMFLPLPESFQQYQMLGFLSVLVPLSVGFLYPFMRNAMGSSAAADQREATWTSSYDLAKVAGRQSGRYLLAAFPVEILAMASASLAVASIFKFFGGE